MAKKNINTTPGWRFLFLVYCAVMIWLLFGRSNDWNSELPYKVILQQNANLIPLLTIRNYLYVLQFSNNGYMLVHCFINLVGNVVLFIPAGWLLPKLWAPMKNFIRFFALCIGFMFMVEVIQLFSLLGRFDVDDLILNLSGMILGFLLYTVRRQS